MGREPDRRRRFFVHSIQRKYFFLSLVPLIICSFLIIFFLFIPLDLLLFSSGSPEGREIIARQLRAVGIRVWPAIFLAMLLSGLLSFFVTHRFAGPLYRFQQVAERIAAGDLPIRVKLRKGDDLPELEDAMNRALTVLDEIIHEAQRLQRDLVGRLEALNQQSREGQGPLRREDLTGLIDAAQRMGTILGRLKVSGE